MQDDIDIVREALDLDGPLAAKAEGFTAREEQQRMAKAVARALRAPSVLVVEAGTGTGKTFAYLVPALLSGRKVLISTGTKNLQDQLFHKDLPTVRAALGMPVDAALLKGRANYLCLQRIEQAGATGRVPRHELAAIRQYAASGGDGDIAGIDAVPEDSPVWPQVTSTADNCLGTKCPHYDDCFVLHARREAQAADVVVINHHLLFADMSLKESGFGELLPGTDAVIIDEAHQLAETANAFFGTIVTARRLTDLARDAQAAFVNDASDTPALRDAADALETGVRRLRLALGDQALKKPWQDWPEIARVEEVLGETRELVASLGAVLEKLAGRAAALEQCWKRCVETLADLDVLFATRSVAPTGDEPDNSRSDAAHREWAGPAVRWIETTSRTFALHLTPLDISTQLARFFTEPPRSWIFTSATLAISGRFDYFARPLGLDALEPDCLEIGSPFPYRDISMLYVPENMPEPNSPGYVRAVLDAALPLIACTRGRAFMLFTSHRALREAAATLKGRFEFPLLVQGQAPRDKLLREFRAHGNAVLLGTGSFWEGVDVRGPALSLVVIDKLPFAPPDDPVLAARLDAIREAGGKPFIDYQVPQAVITLKQGAGRLIRDATDTGVMMICDPRLFTKGYGRMFLDSLPPMPLTRDQREVLAFIKQNL